MISTIYLRSIFRIFSNQYSIFKTPVRMKFGEKHVSLTGFHETIFHEPRFAGKRHGKLLARASVGHSRLTGLGPSNTTISVFNIC